MRDRLEHDCDLCLTFINDLPMGYELFDLLSKGKFAFVAVGVKATIKLPSSKPSEFSQYCSMKPTGNAVDEFSLSNPASRIC